MEIQRCKKEGITNVGFIDPSVVDKKSIGRNENDILKLLKDMLRGQKKKSFILLPYNFE